MSGIMSLVISIYNVGLADNIVTIWFSAWVFALSLAFPVIFVISPLVHRMVSKATGEVP